MSIIFPTLFSVFVNTINSFLRQHKQLFKLDSNCLRQMSVWEELGQRTVFRLIIRLYDKCLKLIKGIVIKTIKQVFPVK